MTTRAIAPLLAVLAVVLLPQAREATQAQSPAPGPPNQPPPTFSSRADAVWLTVFVTDEAGKPVRGLTADDFEVLEKRQSRDITTFQAYSDAATRIKFGRASSILPKMTIRSILPLAKLEPGAYVLEVALGLYGEPDPTVTRTVPFQVR